MTTEWDDVSFVISSRYRTQVLRELSEGPSTPSALADETDSSIAHVSRALNDLRERSMVDLLVSEDRTKGRVYAQTDHGETVWKMIEAENLH